MKNLLYQTETFVEFPADELEQSITNRFEKQVARDPSHLAVHTRKHTLTYEQLNLLANVIAHNILRHCGEGQSPIALLLENDAPMIECILGVLKAGKIYVPLDPSLPSSRLAYIVEDSQAGLLITNAQNSELAVSLTGGKIPILDVDRLDRHAGSDNPRISIPPDSLSWIIYTSGSTGQPKGVVQTHRNVLHYVRNYTNGLSLSSSDRLSVLYSFGVNGAAHEIFSGLLNGASLHPLDIKREGLSGLADWLTDQRLTTYSSVPTVFRHFCEMLTGAHQFPDLRFIKMIGEPVSKREVDLYHKHFSDDCVFINRFGSTETGSIRWYFIDKETRFEGSNVPVGYSVAGNEVLLLDENRKQVADGEIGEIAVKSRYLSPGYWRKPEQTRKAFLNFPDGNIYLTGDMGRLQPDGRLIHMGRKDFQVKIRGHRIETAEIEMALLSVCEAKQAIVMARDDGRGESKLVAYLTMAGRPKPTVSRLRRELARQLPVYMVPSTFMMLDSFPLAPNGKVNRGALPSPDSSRPKLENPFVAPSNTVEQRLTELWSEVLGVDTVGVHDDFFDLGGNSLLSVQLMAKVLKSFGRQLVPAAIFQAPTVELLAKLLQEKKDESLPSIIPVQPNGSRTPFFWIHGDSGNAFLPDYLPPDQPLFGLEHQSQDGRPAQYTRVETITEYYLSQIRKLQPEGPYLLGGYSFGGTIAFETAQRLKEQGQEVSLLIMLDSRFPGSPVSSTSLSESFELSEMDSRREVFFHFRNLAKLEPPAQARYVYIRFADRFNNLVGSRFRRIFKALICKVYLSAGWTLPASVRSFYILNVYKHALENYFPKVYPGRAIYFKSTIRPSCNREGWESQMRDGLEVYEVPGDHMDLIKKENVPTWAGRLASFISKARTEELELHKSTR